MLYIDQNVFLRNGHLVMKCKKNKNPNITTLIFSFRFISAHLPKYFHDLTTFQHFWKYGITLKYYFGDKFVFEHMELL
jgi:hypothetical protein